MARIEVDARVFAPWGGHVFELNNGSLLKVEIANGEVRVYVHSAKHPIPLAMVCGLRLAPPTA